MYDKKIPLNSRRNILRVIKRCYDTYGAELWSEDKDKLRFGKLCLAITNFIRSGVIQIPGVSVELVEAYSTQLLLDGWEKKRFAVRLLMT